MEVRPGQVPYLHEVDDRGAGFVETHTDDLKTRAVVPAISLLKSRQLGNARGAPGGPEIDQHILASQRLRTDGLTRQVVALERRRRLSNLVSPLHLLYGRIAERGTIGKPFL